MSIGYFVGIDPSLNSTGVCVLNANAKIEYLGTIKPGKEARGVPRLVSNRFGLARALARYPNVRGVCIEGYSFNSRSNRAHSTGEWGGMVRLFCYERGYATYVLPPTSLKKFATGRGAGDKSGIILAAYKKFGIDLSGRDDEADALWLAFAALRARFKLESGPSLTIQQKEGLKKIERLPDAQKFSRKR